MITLKTLAKFLAITTVAISVSAPAMAYSGEKMVVCRLNPNGDNFLAFRACGSTNCRMKQKLGPGTYVFTMEPYAIRGWREVILMYGANDDSYSGPTGWVYGKYLCPTGD